MSCCLSLSVCGDPDRNRKLVVKWQGALEELAGWRCFSRASSGRHVRKWDVRLFSSNKGRAGSPPVGLAGGGQAGYYVASLRRAAYPRWSDVPEADEN